MLLMKKPFRKMDASEMASKEIKEPFTRPA
jgi:hypothetical protein